jgi:ABC-type multidrug transport system ATPase subunit
MSSQTLAIETMGLSKHFGQHRAVDTLDLAIHQGSVFGFLGPNGAGKTTTIRMLLGLIRPTSGGGRIMGHDIMSERAAILPHIGAIVESPAFYPYLSGRDNLRALGGYGLASALLFPLVAAVLLLIFTRGRLSYKPGRVVKQNEPSRPESASLTNA